jgi:hemerythrin
MTEHNLMVKTEYPDRIFHDEMHRLLILELTQMESEIKRDGKVFLADRLRHWLFEHILSQDIPLANHLKNVNSNIC